MDKVQLDVADRLVAAGWGDHFGVPAAIKTAAEAHLRILSPEEYRPFKDTLLPYKTILRMVLHEKSEKPAASTPRRVLKESKGEKMIRNTSGLRKMLLETIEGVKSGDIAPQQATSICNLTAQILKSASLDLAASKVVQSGGLEPGPTTLITDTYEEESADLTLRREKLPHKRVA